MPTTTVRDPMTARITATSGHHTPPPIRSMAALTTAGRSGPSKRNSSAVVRTVSAAQRRPRPVWIEVAL
jgi:hypothetical protein